MHVCITGYIELLSLLRDVPQTNHMYWTKTIQCVLLLMSNTFVLKWFYNSIHNSSISTVFCLYDCYKPAYSIHNRMYN